MERKAQGHRAAEDFSLKFVFLVIVCAFRSFSYVFAS